MSEQDGVIEYGAKNLCRPIFHGPMRSNEICHATAKIGFCQADIAFNLFDRA
jgi:hypothetical protein